MVKAWYIDGEELVTDEKVKRSERHLNPPQYISLDELRHRTGVQCERVNVDKYDTDDSLQEICREKGYQYSDILDIHPQRLENYHDKLAAFYTEHMHPDDEVRLVLKGSAYFDVRDVDNNWIRIGVERGDMLNLVGGTYHRFTLDCDGYGKLFRLFGSKADWSSFNRPADSHPARIAYVEKAVMGF
ncbi:unnamed protein product [Medioppia subpectinata]|uniref:Acireductone dioxygenase n=1 Tax=Medioppia subpectinata TaxID=1979941 RepID=A0A7R9L164_9ACAR|nr:unnamed protein product [Medioppia subpectinata]CAG2113573.1 unnamed protein product [Medioppia subpectinata]